MKRRNRNIIVDPHERQSPPERLAHLDPEDRVLMAHRQLGPSASDDPFDVLVYQGAQSPSAVPEILTGEPQTIDPTTVETDVTTVPETFSWGCTGGCPTGDCTDGCPTTNCTDGCPTTDCTQGCTDTCICPDSYRCGTGTCSCCVTVSCSCNPCPGGGFDPGEYVNPNPGGSMAAASSREITQRAALILATLQQLAAANRGR